MIRKVQVYIEGQRIELFNDETIEVSSSIQNIQDLSKVFTDVSLSFSIPCSQVNNPIFEHYYENALNGTINQNLRRDGYIEIDYTFFRGGKIQLEEVVLKNSQPYAYKITFYGEIRSLKDRFGEDKLSQLDYNSFTHPYNGTEVIQRVTGSTDYDIRYPLMSSKRVWQYNEPTTPNDNIDTALGAISYLELFPALKNIRILDAISAAYGVTFTGNFLSDQRFTKSYLHLKNKETFNNVTEKLVMDLTSSGGDLASAFDLANDTMYFQYQPFVDMSSSTYAIITGTWTVEIIVNPSTSDVYTIEVYQNGSLINTINNNGGSINLVGTWDNNQSLYNTLQFQMYAQNGMTVTFQVNLSFDYFADDGLGNIISGGEVGYANGSITLSSNLNIADQMPDMKVADYFAGLLKEWNLTCYALSTTEFKIEPLEDWYSQGVIHDITTYTDIQDITIKRVPLYKKIQFKHQESASFMNKKFKQFYAREYGDLSVNYEYDGQEYIVDVPFEQPLFNKFTGTNVQVGYYLQEEPTFQPYVPKPVILYQTTMQGCSIYMNDGSTDINITNYAVFGQDLQYNNTQWSLNFGQEVSSFYLTTIPNALFDVYYAPYILNMFNLQNRLTEVKTILPISLLTKLKLNDRLVIRDKRYVINEMKSNLTSGDVMFTLLHDFRPLRKRKPIIIKPGTLIHKEPIYFPNGVEQVDIDVSLTPITVDFPVLTSEEIVTFTIPANNDYPESISDEALLNEIISEDGGDVLVQEGYGFINYVVPITYTYENGDVENDEIIFFT
jgi:hypothetical protein